MIMSYFGKNKKQAEDNRQQRLAVLAVPVGPIKCPCKHLSKLNVTLLWNHAHRKIERPISVVSALNL